MVFLNGLKFYKHLHALTLQVVASIPAEYKPSPDAKTISDVQKEIERSVKTLESTFKNDQRRLHAISQTNKAITEANLRRDFKL